MAQSPRAAKNGDMRIDPALVRDLAQLLTDNELTEIEVQDGERRIKVSREPRRSSALRAMPMPRRGRSGAVRSRRCTARKTSGRRKTKLAGKSVKSPMVGTAFLSPEPGAKPFIEVGNAVKAGDTLLHRRSDEGDEPDHRARGGMVKKIMVADAQPVEFDQPLVIIG